MARSGSIAHESPSFDMANTNPNPQEAGLKQTLVRSLGLLWVGQVLTKAIVFLAFAIIARRLVPSAYGAIEYAIGMGALAALAIDGGLGSVGVRRLTQKLDSAATLVALIPAAQFILAVIIAPAMILFVAIYSKDSNALSIVYGVAASVLLLPWKQDWLFQAMGRMEHIVAAQVIRVVVFAAGVMFLIDKDTPLVAVGLIEFVSVASATAYMMIAQHFLLVPLAIRFSFTKLRLLAREGIPIGLGAICWAMTQYAPMFMLATMMGMTQTAYFGAAHRLGVSLVVFSWIYHFNLFPVISRKLKDEPEAFAALTQTSIRATAWAGSAIALALALMAEPLLAILFGPRFVAAAAPFSILVWTFPLTLLSGHPRWILVAAGRAGDMLVAQVSGVVIAVAAGWLLIPYAGMMGAATAMTLACAAVWCVAQIYVRKAGRKVPMLPALPPMIFAAIIIAWAQWTMLELLIKSAIGIAIFVAASFVFDRTLLIDLRNILRRSAAEDTDELGPFTILDAEQQAREANILT